MRTEQWDDTETLLGSGLYALELPDIRLSLSNYGARVVGLWVKDHNGRMDNVVLGYDSLQGYVQASDYMGASIGRFANRIRAGSFVLSGERFHLSRNEGSNTLHGGVSGFDKTIWGARGVGKIAGDGVEFRYISPDGDQGFPGELRVHVRYLLEAPKTLQIEYRAVSTKDTVINLTNHSYFNLQGAAGGTILGHELMIHSDAFLPTDNEQIPTGEFAAVSDTPLDFRKPTTIGSRIGAKDEQLSIGRGYDHNWILRDDTVEGVLHPAATLFDPQSGRGMDIFTTEPGLQFYSGNFIKAGNDCRSARYGPHSGLCLETQHFPDSPNNPGFPGTELRQGSVYTSKTVIRFFAS